MSKLNKKETSDSNYSSTSSSLKAFLLGLLLTALGVYMVFQMTSVQTSWYTWSLGSFSIPTGLVTIPLLIGIGLVFYNPSSFWSKFVVCLGVGIILITIIMSVRIVFTRTSLFNYVLMFGSIVAGIGLMVKGLFPRNKK